MNSRSFNSSANWRASNDGRLRLCQNRQQVETGKSNFAIQKSYDVLRLPIDAQTALLGRYMVNPYPLSTELLEMAQTFNVRLEKIKRWFKIQRRRDIRRGVICAPCRSFKAPHLMSYWSAYTVGGDGRNSSLPEDHPAIFHRPCFRYYFHQSATVESNNTDGITSSPNSSMSSSPSQSDTHPISPQDHSVNSVNSEPKEQWHVSNYQSNDVEPTALEPKLLLSSNWTYRMLAHFFSPKNKPSSCDFNLESVQREVSDQATQYSDSTKSEPSHSPKTCDYVYGPSRFGQYLHQEVFHELHDSFLDSRALNA